MVLQQSLLQFLIEGFKEENLKGSGITRMKDNIIIPEFYSPSIFKFVLNAKMKKEMTDFGNSPAATEVKTYLNERCFQNRENFLENSHHYKAPIDGFVSVMFYIDRKIKLKNFYEICTCFVSIIDVSGKKQFTQSFSANLDYVQTEMDGHTVCVGIDEYINCSTLLEQKEELLPNDTLTVLFDLTLGWCDKTNLQFDVEFTMEDWLGVCELVDKAMRSNEQSELFEDETRERREDMYGSGTSIWECLGYLTPLEESVVECSEFDLSPWKEALCEASPYFESMFSAGLLESLTETIFIPRGEDCYYAMLMHSVLNNTVDHVLGVDSLLRMYVIADKYMIGRVKKMCVNEIMNHIGVADSVKILLLAHKFSECELEEKVTNFILDNWGFVIQEYAWRKLKVFEPDLYDEMLRQYKSKQSAQNSFSLEKKDENSQSHFSLEPGIEEAKDESFDFYS